MSTREVDVKIRWTVVPLLLLSLACRRAPAQPGTAAAAPGVQSAPAAQGAPPAQAVPAAQAATPVKPVPATLPDVLARVNGEAVPKADFEQAVRSLEARAGQGVPFEKRNEVYRQVLDQLIGYRLLVQETKTRKLTVTDAEVDTQIAQIRQRFPDEAAFTKALGEQNVTLAKLKQDTRTQMMISKIIEAEVGPTISVTDKDVQTFYDQNKERFNEPEAVQASHILIRFPEKADEAAKKQARARAETVMKQVKAGGNFAALAKEFSQDPGSAANGGDLGFFPKGQMVPAFDATAFSLKPGQISGIVETPFGYHIIKVADHRAARTVPLTEVSQQIRQFLTQQQQQQKAEAFVNQLKAKAKIIILI
ncbi:MAG: peptidylprolyl isomerase [Acidobacteria bacterium]|nr:peptidylprolyl isomerase [Acidobacteriota bacterium]